MAYLYSIYPCEIYTDDLPQGFNIPSIYLPPLNHFDSSDSTTTYLTSYSLFGKVFAETTREACDIADQIATSLKNARNLIPLVNSDGSPANGYIRIKRVEVRQGDVGVSLLNLSWDSRYKYLKEQTYPKMGKFHLSFK